MSPRSAAWSFLCREQFLLLHRPFSLLETSSLGIQNLFRGRQHRYNSNKFIGLNFSVLWTYVLLYNPNLSKGRQHRYSSNEVIGLNFLILWIYTTQGCCVAGGISVLELSPQPKAGVTHKSVCIMSTRSPLSAKCKLQGEILDLFDKTENSVDYQELCVHP